MTESTAKAPAGWYPANGVERYWDGVAWTTQTRPLVAKPVESTATDKPSGRPVGKIRQIAQNVKQAMDEAAEERAEALRQVAEAYGAPTAQAQVGSHSVEIRDGGYVRVGGSPRDLGAFEKLRGINFSHSTIQVDKSKGGRALGAAATMGLSKLNSNEKIIRSTYLTVVTDKTTHRLGGCSVSDGLALEAAGNAVLDMVKRDASRSTPAESASAQTPAEKLRDIAALHKDGILSDEEFAAAKAKFIEQI